MAVRPPLSSSYPRHPYDGLSVDDVLAALGLGHPFGYTELKKAQVDTIMKKLKKEEIIYKLGTNRKRFGLTQKSMESFLIELFEILDTVITPRIEIGVKNSEKASFEYTNFYESVYGKKNTMRHFAKFRLIRQRYKDMKRHKKAKKVNEITKRLEYNDYNIYDMIHNLKSNYNDLITRQPFLIEAFIDCVCPPFFDKNGVGKKYPKISFAASKSTLKFLVT